MKKSSALLSLQKALLLIDTEDKMEAFLKDLCTPLEIKSMTERWRVCQILHDTEFSYREIHEKTGASLTTIGRVSRFLKEESNGGYRIVLAKIKKNTLL